MKNLLALLLFLAPAFSSAMSFHTMMDSYHQSPKPQLTSSVYNYEYVFVAGFLNEGLFGYFKDNIDLLEEVGIDKRQIHVISPSSKNGVTQNAEILAELLSDINKRQNRQLVIIAHSKGALETLTVAVSKQSLIDKAVKKMFLVQGALKGSAVADYVAGKGHEADEKMPAKERVLFRLAGKTAKILDPILNQGLSALTHDYTSNLWKRLFALHGTPSQAVSEKITYVVSHDHPILLSKVIDSTGTYIGTYYGKNDGLVALKDQYFTEFGSVLATIKADHADLFAPWPISNTRALLRRAFTFGLLRTL